MYQFIFFSALTLQYTAHSLQHFRCLQRRDQIFHRIVDNRRGINNSRDTNGDYRNPHRLLCESRFCDFQRRSPARFRYLQSGSSGSAFSHFLQPSASIAITKSGSVSATIPRTISTVSIPVCPMTPGTTALTSRVLPPRQCAYFPYSFTRCLVISRLLNNKRSQCVRRDIPVTQSQ